MIFVAILLLIVGVLVSLGSITQCADLFTKIGRVLSGEVDFGYRLSAFFAPQYLTSKKVFLFLGIAAVIAGVVVLIIGLQKKKQNAGKSGPLDTKVLKYLRDLNGERKKVVWPSFKTVRNNTAVTLVLCVLVALIVCLIDAGLGALVNLILSI